jgi:hypothetical protein
MNRRPHPQSGGDTALTIMLAIFAAGGVAAMLLILHLLLMETPIVDLRL